MSPSNNTWYNLSFGGTDSMPRCSCPDFSRTGFLCKHFFAVFEHRDDGKWDALPKSYRENPYLCLDDTIVFDDKVETTPFTEKKRKNEENVEKKQKNTYLYQYDEKETHLPTELASKPPPCVANILSMCQ
ncbi:unnamed protein product [Porites lobata]|uniref:SWIM-type domain-containing protein n=1 Tax=Porites lobata TaxID=104759 RepID=A0ABN8PZK5_9CNID|nr:unnamed protein product [Porites lobata]